MVDETAPTGGDAKADIFVSYAREDREKAKALGDLLRVEGWTVWWDRKIAPGRAFDEVIEHELRSCRCAIVIWSVHSVISQWVKNEARKANGRGVLIPVRVDDAEIPLEFAGLQTADLTTWELSDNPELDAVKSRIAELTSRQAAVGARLRQPESIQEPIGRALPPRESQAPAPEEDYGRLAGEVVETAPSEGVEPLASDRQPQREHSAQSRLGLWLSLTSFGRLTTTLQIIVATALLALTWWALSSLRRPDGAPVRPPDTSSNTGLARQLASLRERAKDQYQAGHRSQALESLVAGLKIDPQDPDLLRTLTLLDADAVSAVRNAKHEATTAQAASRAGADMTQAAQKETEAADLRKNARTDEAIRSLWSAAESYSRAGARASEAAAQLDAFATRARTHLQSGQRRQALDAALEGLTIDAAFSPLHDVINVLWRDARAAVESSKRQAVARGPSAASSQEFEKALRTEAAAMKASEANNMSDAVRSLWAANSLFAKAAERDVPLDAARLRIEEEYVLEVLDEYKAAYNRMNAAAVKRLQPSVAQSQLARLFAEYRSYSMTISNPQITISGDTAVVACTIRTNILPRVGQAQTETRRTTVRLQKFEGSWIITERR